MSDYSELRRLAEAARSDNSRYGDADCYEPTFGLTAIETAFASAATPAVVLALIAENERVKARLCVCRDCAGQGETYSGHDSYQGHFQPPEPDMDVCGTCGGDGVLGALEDFETLAAERDLLKAENERLRACAERIYRAAWDESGEGWNAEYPGDVHCKPEWNWRMKQAIDGIMSEGERT